jgi:formylglycine-generating enzyme required for sulfatase activity
MNRIFLITLLAIVGLQGSTGSAYGSSGEQKIRTIADGAGNGGGVWVCQNNDQANSIRWIQLVDLYEAETEFSLSLENFGTENYKEIIESVKSSLLSVNKNLHEKLLPYFEKVDSSIKEIDADLETIDDALYRVRPSARDCTKGGIKYVQLANFTKYGAVLVNKYLFNNSKLQESDKAALILHEVLYSFLRDRYGDTDSVRTRKVVGYIFSTLSDKKISKKIHSVLGHVSRGLADMNFIPVYKGSFKMGSPSTEDKRYIDEDERPVTITYDYEMMTTEVTQAMYFEVMGRNPSYFKERKYCPQTFEKIVSHTTGQKVSLCPNNPVEQVSYDDAENFITMLNSKNGMKYRLPTEAEWEYAANAGSQAAYSFGENENLLSEYAIFTENSGSTTHPVGSLRSLANAPGPNGLYDMYGNVSEWTQDFYIKSPEGGINPKGPIWGTYFLKVVRGGAWYSSPRFMRSASRHNFEPKSRLFYLGFRLVRTLQ